MAANVNSSPSATEDGRQLVAELVAQSVKAGASVSEIAKATKRPQQEIEQLLDQVNELLVAANEPTAQRSSFNV